MRTTTSSWMHATGRQAMGTVLAILLCACTAPDVEPGGTAREAAADPSDAPAAPAPGGEAMADAEPGPVPAPAPASGSRPPPPGLVPPRMSEPLPPQRVREPVQLDRTCRTDADCTVKDVGNCCGAYPSCVNVDSPTDPDAVQARCAAEGMASVCGFPAVTGCTCVQGRCRDVTAGAPALE